MDDKCDVVSSSVCEVRHCALRESIKLQKEIFETRFDAADMALELKTADVERRLEMLNQLRSEVISDRDQFVRKEYYDLKIADLDKLDTRVTVIETRSVVWTAAIGMFFVILQLAMFYFHSLSKPVIEYNMKAPQRIEAPSRN